VSEKSKSSSSNESGYARRRATADKSSAHLVSNACHLALSELRPRFRLTLTRLRVLESESLPVEQVRQALGAVSLVDPLPASLLAERDHLVRELVDRVLDRLHAAVDDVDTARAHPDGLVSNRSTEVQSCITHP
jgi:hypothetical protein